MLLVLSLLFIVFGAAQAAQAATYTVDTTADNAALTACTTAANDCSLRGAVINANASAGADTINFDQTVFSTAQTITLSSSSPIQQLVINSDLTINGPGASLLTVKGYVNYGGIPIFEISGGAVGINNLKLTGGGGKNCVDYSTGAAVNTTCGGAIYMSGGTVTVSGSAFSGNNAGNGGAIYTRGGSLNVSGSTISNNGVTAYQSGGGIYTDGNSAVTITNSTVSDNIAGVGAGILVADGTLSLANSTVSGNVAKNYTSTFTFQCPSFDYCYSPPPGTTCNLGTQTCSRTVSNNGIVGGILNRGGTVNVTNSTVSGNTAQGSGNGASGYGGGGIDNRSYLTVANSTITNNSGESGGGIINRGTLSLSNNIVAGNRASSGADIFNYPGATTSGNYNLVQNGDAVSGTGNITGVDAKLGALASNGGPTQTHALLQGSPAIDAGDPNFDATATPFDQRGPGFARKIGSRIDIGAFEGYFYGVNTLTDHDDGFCTSTDCTLREAVKYAPDGTTINFGVTGTIILTGGEIAITKNLTIIGPATTPGITVSGNNSSRIFYVNINSSNAAFNFSNLTLTGGNGGGSGTNGAGGAIYIDATPSTVMITNSTISGNTASGNAGGIRGGTATLIIINSTISGNTASGATSNGGGLRLAGVVKIANSTISGNTAANGGGIYYSYANPSYTLTLTNSIVAGNTAATTAPDISNSSNGSNTVAGDYNLVQNTSGATLTGTHNITGQDPKLGALASNGGATKTMALLANSPAINAGDPNFDTSATFFDQRGTGFARKVGSAIDIGAFEVQPVAAPTDLTITKTHSGNFTQGDAGKTYTITVTNSGETASSGTVSVTDTLPAGLTATAIAGTGWNCNITNLTCTRSDALAAGGIYPAINLTVNVASDASASVTNTAAVSVGGETNTSNNTASDPTAINTAPRYLISGTIRYGITPSGQPDSFTSGVNLNATGTASASAASDGSGIYQLSNLLGGDYTVTPSKIGDIKGINSLDATRIQQHLVGMTTLSANQSVAADTDGNGVVNSLDATRIQQSLIGMQTANIIGQWKFVPGNRQYNALSGNQTGQDFAAILVGEVSGNWASASSFANGFQGDGNNENTEKALFLETSNQNQTVERFKDHPFGQFSADTKQSSDLPVSEATTGANAAADIQVSLPASATASNGSTVTVPITISQIPAGQPIESFDFSVFYNPAILQPTVTPGSSAGTLSANCSVLSFSPVSGRVIVSGACAQAVTSGSGVLYNLTFTVIGAANQTSSLSFTNPATNVNTFQFNNGTPTAATANGSFTVLGTTAASVSLSGRVLTPSGRGLTNAVVTMIDSTGAVRYARSNTFGYFHFENVAAGQTCVFQINSKRYTFAPQVLTITDNVTELNFTAR